MRIISFSRCLGRSGKKHGRRRNSTTASLPISGQAICAVLQFHLPAQRDPLGRALPGDVVDSEQYLLTLMRYIELNPVRAGMEAALAQGRHIGLDAGQPRCPAHILGRRRKHGQQRMQRRRTGGECQNFPDMFVSAAPQRRHQAGAHDGRFCRSRTRPRRRRGCCCEPFRSASP